MSNGFGSLYVGSAGLRSAQNAINVVANNLSNVDTKGYVRQQALFEDLDYQKFGNAAIAPQKAGLGVQISDVVHYRDQFIDRTVRTAFGRESFYSTCYEATQEVETLLRELTGAGYSDTIDDLYQSMAEFAKDPSDTANQNVLIQTSSLFLAQTQAIYDSIKDYQNNLNSKIMDDVDQINDLADKIYKLNIQIQRIEAANVETAMDLRDARDMYLDELSSLASIEYAENEKGIVQVKLEGVYLVTDTKAYHMETYAEDYTGFRIPFWKELSEPEKNQYYEVFPTKGIDPTKKNDVGELKALLLTRGDHYGNYVDLEGISSEVYEAELSKSVATNTMAEMDAFVNAVVKAMNQLVSPATDLENDPKAADIQANMINGKILGTDDEGHEVLLGDNTKVLDVEYSVYGTDHAVPPHEIFKRSGCDRFSSVQVYQTQEVTDPVTGATKYEFVLDGAGNKIPVTDADGNPISIYVYNEEDYITDRKGNVVDTSMLYCINSISVNDVLVKDATKIGFKYENGDIAYDMSEKFTSIWGEMDYHLNPSDLTPCDFSGFYVKVVGDLANKGSVYRTTSETLNQAVEQVENSRQGVIGVSSDEELVNMIRFQNAYNASSRYMSVISQMIEHLVTSLGR